MKHFLLFLIALAISSMSFATPLTGTKTVGTGQDYATLALAIADLNTNGVGANGVTFNVVAGHTETLTAPLSITVTGTASDQIIFQKFGAGANPLITAYVGTATPTSAVQDGMWNLVGSDYVTIDGIDLYDPNVANPATMEYGFAMFKASVTDGCQYNTIKNCVVTLNRINNASSTAPAVEGSRAIYVANSTAAAQVTALTPTSASGTNSYNKFYTNTLQNCNYGIALSGYAAATPFTLGDTGNDIGGTSSFTGNTILNYGGAASATNPAAGIRANNQWGVNISYNTINNNNGSGANHANTLRGIYAQAGTSANATINNNTITLTSGATTSSAFAIDNAIGSTAASNTVEIKNNTITGAYPTATSGAWYGIQNTGTPATLTVSYNTVQNVSTPGTGSLYGMVLGSPTTLNVTNNSVLSLTKTGIGAIYGIQLSTATITCQNNTVDGLQITAASSTAGVFGIYNGASAVVETYSNNIIRNLSNTGAGNSTYGCINGLFINSATGNKTIQNNQLYNFTVNTGTGAIYGIKKAYGAADDISGNQVYNLGINGTSSASIYGIYSSAGTTCSIYNNNIYALNTAGGTGGATYGIYASTASNTIYKNQIYNLASASTGPTLYGLYIVSGTTNTAYNNFISDLRTPAANSAIPLAGIYVSGGTTANLFYNTVYLNASSTGALFGCSAIYASTSPTLDMRNNILVNNSIGMGANGFVTAFRRSSTTLTSYSANSNANCFYAGTPGINNLIMYDGTNSYQDMAAYQTAVGARDAISFRELPPFVNVATAPFNLHVQTTVATLCESGGVAISSPIAVTTDFDGDTRGGNPDVGADEFVGIPGGVINPGSVAATAISSQQINVGFATNPSGNNVLVVWSLTNAFTTPSGAPPSAGSSFAGGTVLYYGTSSPVSQTGLTYNVPVYYKLFSYDGSAYSSGVTATSTPVVAPPTALTATAVSSSQINLAYTLNAQANNVIIASAATSTFGVPVNGTAYIATDPITGGGTVIYVGPLAAFNHTGLTSNTAYYYKVWSYDAYTYYSATGATANATTKLVVATPYLEGFATTTTPAGYSITGWSIGSTRGVTGNPGNNIYKNIYSTGTSGTNFSTVDVGPVTSGMFLSFDYKLADYSSPYAPPAAGSGNYVVSVSTDYGVTYTDLETVTNNAVAGWQLKQYDLTAYAGSQVKVKITGNWVSGDYDLAFDNIKIETPPSCPAPSTLLATPASFSASLAWTETGSATSWDIEYGPTGFTQGTGTTVTGVTNPYTLNGLTPVTGYAYYVRANCGGSLYSTWSGPKTFTTLVACPAPTTATATGITTNSALLGWTETGTATTWDIEWGPAGFTQGTGTTITGVTSNPYSLTGLSSATNYAFYVRAYCSSTYQSTWLGPKTFMTLCGTTTVPYAENFDTYTVPAVGCGTVQDVNADLVYWKTTTGTTYAGANKLSIGYSAASVPMDDWYFTQGIVLTAGVSYDLKFYHRVASSTWYENLEVKYGTSASAAGMTSAAIFTAANYNNQTYAQGAASFTPATSGTYYMGFHCYSAGDQDGIYLDQITLDVTPSCVDPTLVNATAVTATSASINWTASASAPSSGYQIYYSTSSTAPTAGTTPTGTVGAGIVTFATGAVLTPATTYYAWVRSDCGGGLYSPWSSPVATFTTLCNPVTTLSQNFDAVASPNLPVCWNKYVSPSYSYQTVTTYTTSPSSSPNCVQLYSSGATLAADAPMLISAPISNLNAGNYQLRFSAKGASTNVSVIVGTMSDPLNSATFTPFQTVTGLSTSLWTEYTVNFATYTGTDQYIAFQHPLTTTYSYIYIDDVNWEPVPLCPKPSALTAAVAGFQATLGWTENGTATTWEVQYGPSGFTFGTGTTVTGITTNPYLLTGLTPSTAYDFYVRAYCDAINQSAWTGPKSFATTVACPAPTTLHATTLYATKAVLDWTETGSATLYNVEYGLNGFTQGTGTMLTAVSKPLTITGLTGNTAYQFYVQADCGSGYTSTVAGPGSFTTLCGSYAAPYGTTTFEGSTFPVTCWTRNTGLLADPITLTSTTSGWIQDDWQNVTTVTNKAAKINIWSTGTKYWLMTPEIDLGAGDPTQRLEFDLTLNDYGTSDPITADPNGTTGTDDKFAVAISTDGGISWTTANTLRLWDNAGSAYVYNNISATGEHVIIPLAAYTGNIMIGFYGESTISNADNDLMIDNVYIGVPPTCAQPTGFAASGVTINSASLAWTGAATVDVEFGAVGHIPGSGTIQTGITANPYTLSGLASATAYDVYIRQYCGVGSVSTWVGPVSFTTLCGITTAPITEDFTSTTFPPTCWTKSTTPAWIRAAATSSATGTGSAEANFYSISSATPFNLTTMDFDATALGTAALKFNWAYAAYPDDSYGSFIDEMDIYYSTDHGTTFTLLLAMPGGPTGILNNTGLITSSPFTPTTSQWATKLLVLPAGTNMVQFKAISAYGNNLYLDNVQIMAAPTHDVVANSIDMGQVLNAGAVISPKATISNAGINTETFTATLTIGAYTSTQTVTALAPSSSIQVTFDPFTPALGDYTASLDATLGTDVNPADNTLSMDVKVLDLNKMVYAYRPSTPGPIKFSLSDPATITQIATQTGASPVYAATWANNQWFAVEYLTGAYNLITFDPTTGARTVIGNTGLGINGLSFNPNNSTLYGVTYSTTTTASTLYTINMTTGAATLIGNTATNTLLINLAINNAGVCYAVDIIADKLGTVDLATGAFTAIGPIGIDANYAQDMEFDRDANELYMAAYGTTGQLRWVNTATGSTSLIGGFASGAEITGFAIPYNPNKTLNVKVYLEGLYNVGLGVLNQAMDINPTPMYTAPVADKMIVELHDATTPYDVVQSYSDVDLNVSGLMSIATIPGGMSGSYYIVVKHRNSMETWSAAPFSFAGSGPFTYDFTTAATQAYGDNLKPMGSIFAIYGGDVNVDGVVDGSDMANVDNASTGLLQGYFAEDANGDGVVDGSDMAIVDNNATAVIQAQRPPL